MTLLQGALTDQQDEPADTMDPVVKRATSVPSPAPFAVSSPASCASAPTPLLPIPLFTPACLLNPQVVTSSASQRAPGAASTSADGQCGALKLSLKIRRDESGGLVAVEAAGAGKNPCLCLRSSLSLQPLTCMLPPQVPNTAYISVSLSFFRLLNLYVNYYILHTTPATQ